MWLDYSEAAKTFDLPTLMPSMGSPVVKDRVGMGIAIVTLQASLRPGLYARHLQYQAMRKTPTWFANAYHAGTAYQSNSLYAKDDRKLHATSCPTAGEWFVRFKHGARLRMGEVRRQNEALSSQMVLAILREVDQEWLSNPVDEIRRPLEEFAAALLISFGTALRGEEVTLVSLRGMLETWEECTESKPHPYIMITLHGRFKGETGLRWHCLPLSIHTRSGLPFKKWIGRLLLRTHVREGRSTGWLFARENGSRKAFSEYDPLLLDYLGRAREEDPTLMSTLAEISDFSFRRSLRSGATTEATNAGVPGPCIELIGRWRKKEAARGSEPGLPMRQVYTRVRDSVEGLLRFSRSL
jgi:hypothetical protein